MSTKKYYKVDLSKSPTWQDDFRRDCEDNNCIFEVVKESYGQVVLRRSHGSGDIWNHDKRFGDFYVQPPPIEIKLDEGLFEI